MYFVYILQSIKFRRYYIGVTSDFEKRLEKHNSGGNRSTKAYRPWELILKEGFKDKNYAWQREKEIKSWKSGIKLNN